MVKNEYSQHDRYEGALAALRDTRSAVGTTGWRCTGRRRRRAPLSGLWRIAQREQAEDAGSEAPLTGTGAGRWERELSLRRDGTFARAPPYPSIPQGWLSDTERSTRQGRIVDPEPIELKPLRFHAIGRSTVAMSDISITHLQLLNEFALRFRRSDRADPFRQLTDHVSRLKQATMNISFTYELRKLHVAITCANKIFLAASKSWRRACPTRHLESTSP